MATNTYVPIYLDEAQALADYTSLEQDLRCALRYAKELQKDFSELGDYIEPLMVAAVIKYGRAFSGGIRRVQLYKEIEVILREDLRQAHEHIIAIRDKYVAHSVNSYEANQPIARYWVERVKEEGITSIECQHERILCLSGGETRAIVDLSTTWLNYLEEKLKGEKTKLLKIVREIPIEDVLKNEVKTPMSGNHPPRERRKN